jgi:hypothetical protein
VARRCQLNNARQNLVCMGAQLPHCLNWGSTVNEASHVAPACVDALCYYPLSSASPPHAPLSFRHASPLRCPYDTYQLRVDTALGCAACRAAGRSRHRRCQRGTEGLDRAINFSRVGSLRSRPTRGVLGGESDLDLSKTSEP